MLVRLWWKEYRVFGPVWLTLVLVAAGLQGLFLSTGSEDVRSGALTVIALCWAVLYAFAVGAAAFAGERESNTLGFLDALPVGRRTLWVGKVSFAFVSTFGLALVLAALAALGTEARDPIERYSYPDMIRVFGTLLVEALGWGLFWSSLTRNPLLAGALVVPSVYASAVAMTRLAAPHHLLASNDFVAPEAVPYRISAALAALAVSLLVMARRPAAARSSGSRSDASRSDPIEIRGASTGRSLTWQVWREGWTTWLLVALVSLVIPVGGFLMDRQNQGLYDLVLVVIASMVAGVSVFGTENAPGNRRFLVHHGVSPGTVWGRKLLAWSSGMALLLGLMMLTFVILGGPFGSRDTRLDVLTLSVVDAFAVGILCGMTIRRRLTAALVGLLFLFAIVPLQAALASQGMIPTWSLVLTPLILIGVSRAWAADWLLEREGYRPWLRLALLITVPFELLGASYFAYRAFAVRDIGPQLDGAALQGGAIPPGQDAAEEYRRAIGLIPEETWTYLTRMEKEGEDTRIWKMNQGAIELTRKASSRPRARFDEHPNPQGMWMLGHLMDLDTRERLSRKDLPAAWDDILALFRMATHLGSSSPTLTRMTSASQLHQKAVSLAFDWLAKPGQTPETIRRALNDLQALPPVPNLVETIRVESSIIERTLDQSGSELAKTLLVGVGGRPPGMIDFLIFEKVIAAPWERERARRVCRHLFAYEIRLASVEPWEWKRVNDWPGWVQREFNGSRLIRLITPSFLAARDKLDRDLVESRALVQAVAVLAWKLDHSGEYPGKLEDLVPGYLPRLPLDLYSGKPFGYVRSVQPLRPVWPRVLSPSSNRFPTRADQPLIYSVGPDRKDDGGMVVYNSIFGNEGDSIFAIP